jgi:hypothetical protein
MRIAIKFSVFEIEAELMECTTAFAAYNSLPFESYVNRWGDEIYFDFPISAVPENLKQTMEVGDIGYWLEGQAVAIFFGPTPSSTDGRPKAAVPVIHFGRVTGDPSLFQQAGIGDAIRLETL